MIDIREASKDDIPALYELYDAIGKKDAGYFEHAFEAGAVPVMAYADGQLSGFALLNWNPRYSLYRKLGIPEIQDLNILPEKRRRGIARAIVEYCEEKAREKQCEMIGIAVGLTKEYGPAQIMYIKMGYMPDGNGATYDREGVQGNMTYTLDDDFALMLIKPL